MQPNILLLFAAAMTLFSAPVMAHEGHGDTSTFTSGTGPANAPVTLTDESIANLGVKTIPAALEPLAEIISLPAVVTLLPEQQAFITTRFDGQVRDIKVKAGEKVTKWQDLLVVEPLNVGVQLVTLKSPISGTIIRQNVVIGQPVSFESILMEVGDNSRMLVKGTLYETSTLSRLKAGQKASAKIGIYDNKTFEGTLERVDAGPETESRALHTYAIFDNADGALRPNLRGTLNIEIGGEDTPTIVIPASAVLENNGTSFVFVRDGNNFERREVALGRKEGDKVEIISGVLPDEDVVFQGNYQIQYLKPAAKPVTAHTEGH
ncbi:MAG: efflux RND transporter periplasmic adaptor subunit [Alphaproteobacteria bacterium]|nr:efflux RND transporter periplasmic adaptor subunit [Alphaproteobacteria bacterium]QQS57901.1 MAG: efflux RND transporter periplasmic adaptor subunit [Alphaproteobacteria bacterium]